MGLPLVRRLSPALVILAAVASGAALFALGPSVRADCGTATSSPCPTPTPPPPPTPTPVNAFLSLDVTSGGPNTQITVNGGAFLANEQMTLYWDQPNKVAGGANADGSGNFVTKVKPFSGDAPGVHKLCASVPPNPCANFNLEATAPTPSPSPTPSESVSPTPNAITSAGPTASPVAATISGLDVISRPPFVLLPIIGVAAILISLAFWVLSAVRRPGPLAIPSAAVVHRAMRPDYSAGFGAPPPAPAPAAPEPSAWPEEPPHPTAAPETPAAGLEEPPTPAWDAQANTAAWGPGVPDSGYPELAPPEEPPELPEHGDLPEPGE